VIAADHNTAAGMRGSAQVGSDLDFRSLAGSPRSGSDLEFPVVEVEIRDL